MIWEEWCLVIAVWFVSIEIAFEIGKRHMAKLIKQLDDIYRKKVQR